MTPKEFLESYDPQIKEVGYDNYFYSPQQVIERIEEYIEQAGIYSNVSGKRLIQLQIDLENVTIHLNQICRALEQIQAASASGAVDTGAVGGIEKCTCPDDQCLLGDHPICRWAEYARKSSEEQP